MAVLPLHYFVQEVPPPISEDKHAACSDYAANATTKF
jgi:hypothetical protein